jgi:hypothetical protein
VHDPNDRIDPWRRRPFEQLAAEAIVVLTPEKHSRFVAIPFAIQVGFFADDR